MYQALLYLHNGVRWLVLASLLFALYRAYKGFSSNARFSKTDNAVRHWTATFAHIQLLIGMVLYFQSPVVRQFMASSKAANWSSEPRFFGIFHSSAMLLAIVLVTIGSAKAKRAETDRQKFKTLLIWYFLALAIIFLVIPWPFSPFANRPYFR